MLNLFTKNNRDKVGGEWLPVSELAVGMRIAVPKNGVLEEHATGRINSREWVGEDDVLWDEIASIEDDGKEQVYDIEVEGTHNFIGNNIFAHNTYTALFNGGNVGIGTASPAQKLDVAGNINISAGSAYMYNGTNVITASTTLGNYFFGNAGNLSMTGTYNIAGGYQALYLDTSGGSNTAIGFKTLYANQSGADNAALGYQALYSNTTGSNNTALGAEAGHYIADGLTANSTSANSLYLGYGTQALASGDTNEIVIGYNATGNGSNSATLGNTSITKTILQGNVGIGTSSPETTLTVVGAICAARGAGVQTTACGTTAGAIYANSSSLSGGYDVAEAYPVSDSSIGAGDLVSFDPRNPGALVKATSANALLGVISTEPGLTLGAMSERTRAVALSGHVPVKVNLDGGSIEAGDRISISDTPGVGARAASTTETIGVALQSWNGPGQGTIDVFVDRRLTGLASASRVDSLSLSTTNTLQLLSADIASSSDAYKTLNQNFQLLSARIDALSSSTNMQVPALSTSSIETIAVSAASSTVKSMASSSTFIASVAAAVQNVIQSTGNWVVDKFTAHIAYVDRVEAKVAAVSEGLEMTDQVTGQVYCVAIANGDWKKMLGPCGTATSTQIVANPSPSANTPASSPIINAPSTNTITPVTVSATTTSTTSTTSTSNSSSTTTPATTETATSTTTTTPTTSTGGAASPSPSASASPSAPASPLPSPTPASSPAASPVSSTSPAPTAPASPSASTSASPSAAPSATPGSSPAASAPTTSTAPAAPTSPTTSTAPAESSAPAPSPTSVSAPSSPTPASSSQ